jgi:hypothetical protein
MIRSMRALAIAAVIGYVPHVAEAENAAFHGDDQVLIYQTFLGSWVGKEKKPLNVSLKTEAPTAEDLKQFTDCTGNTAWTSAETEKSSSNLLAGLPYVRLVDPDTWTPRDPGDAIAKGETVHSAVRSGFDHGLMTFSAVVFDKSHSIAAFTYSFVCGRLCGNGGTAIFKATPGGWIRTDKQCGGWISQLRLDRSNKSFKPNPLRGSA